MKLKELLEMKQTQLNFDNNNSLQENNVEENNIEENNIEINIIDNKEDLYLKKNISSSSFISDENNIDDVINKPIGKKRGMSLNSNDDTALYGLTGTIPDKSLLR